MKTLFKQIISDFHTWELKKVFPRTLKVPLQTGKIISLIWPRRAGKTSLLFNVMQSLLQQGKDKKDIVYVNFEDERIHIQGEQLHVIIDAYMELYPDKDIQQTFFFFDEIQNITGREKFIRRIYDQGMSNLFITGSNAKLLSKEIATALRGRSLSFELLPLSFSEFLTFKQEDLNPHVSKEKAKLLHLQTEYLQWWGFPEILPFEEDLKIKTLQEYFDVMLYNDIIERYSVKEASLLKQFIKHLLQTTTKEYSISKISNTLKSQGFSFDKNLPYTFVDYLATVYFGKSIAKYDHSFKRQTLKKRYLFDNGYLNALSFNFSDNVWKLLENAVFTELWRVFGDHIYFLKGREETDFVIDEKENIVLQVCYHLHDQDREREISGCLEAMKQFNVKQSFIITADQEEAFLQDGKEIIILPFYKWAKN